MAPVFLLYLVAARLVELVIARRDTARLMAAGAREVGAGHYPVMVALHASWLAALVLFGWDNEVRTGWLVAFAALQVLRVWILGTLGPRWTTRVIVTDTPLVRRGPFSVLNHPNYTLVVAEIVVAPMVLGLGWVAALWTVLNFWMLTHRIAVEDAAIRPGAGPT
ncbi:isoprenylcysteine carboxyl methyltransferase family protein [Wenxinia saemankumensis]|uniref:Methyltransferase n=1 Tax=Wenxinia saemankumensis TaxID=1447782 RepID=A0A1M6H284_9RHOB|nr:isoprenylcysteine carboxylmethyltransferase family protein [Wenxinia saemankumensis]SHJ16265.1 methyltransferase [Wenxinia saemankumensis]